MSTELRNEADKFHSENPWVYELINQAVEELWALGIRRWGIAAIWEVIRYDRTIQTDGEPVKMPNNHRAYYARMWIRNNPDRAEFFRTATLRSETSETPDRFGRFPDDLDENPWD